MSFFSWLLGSAPAADEAPPAPQPIIINNEDVVVNNNNNGQPTTQQESSSIAITIDENISNNNNTQLIKIETETDAPLDLTKNGLDIPPLERESFRRIPSSNLLLPPQMQDREALYQPRFEFPSSHPQQSQQAEQQQKEQELQELENWKSHSERELKVDDGAESTRLVSLMYQPLLNKLLQEGVVFANKDEDLKEPKEIIPKAPELSPETVEKFCGAVAPGLSVVATDSEQEIKTLQEEVNGLHDVIQQQSIEIEKLYKTLKHKELLFDQLKSKSEKKSSRFTQLKQELEHSLSEQTKATKSAELRLKQYDRKFRNQQRVNNSKKQKKPELNVDDL